MAPRGLLVLFQAFNVRLIWPNYRDLTCGDNFNFIAKALPFEFMKADAETTKAIPFDSLKSELS